jgi:hypothetical protein
MPIMPTSSPCLENINQKAPRRNMIMNLKILPCLAAIFIALFMGPMKGLFAADPQPPKSENRIEVTIIHVDKYGVYAPNLIFYWDPGMNKQKISALTGIAEQLRNKNAVITYATTSDITRDKRPVVVDIAAFKGEPPQGGESPSAKEHSRPAQTGTEENPPLQTKEETKPESGEVALRKPIKEPVISQPKPVLPDSPTIISRAEVARFVHNCIDAVQSKDVERSLVCYGDQVDYYAKGTVSKDFIRKDKGYYFKNWDRINSSIDGDIVLIVIDQPDLKIAKFTSRFRVENSKNTVSGRAENIWKIQKVGNELKIVDEKQKIIDRDSP